jgi:hypothetical protein
MKRKPDRDEKWLAVIAGMCLVLALICALIIIDSTITDTVTVVR